MSAISETAQPFLAWLWRTSWQSAILIGLLVLAQWVFRRQLTPRWRCALWWLVLLRLALPWSPPSPVSLFNWFRGLPSLSHVTARAITPESEIKPAPATAIMRSPLPVPIPPPTRLPRSSPASQPSLSAAAPAQPSSWRACLVWSYLGVASLLLILLLSNSWQLSRRVRRQRLLTNTAVLDVVEDCKQVMGLHTPVTVVETTAVPSPSLHGFVRPRLLLPAGLRERFSLAELRYVFLHELSHVKRQDILLNWLMIGLQILHWFNPLVWLAFARLRSDRELACDALALAYAGESHRQSYGQAIIRLLEDFSRPALAPGLAGILEDKNHMKRRIDMIAAFKHTNRWPALAMAIFTCLALVALTDAQTKVETTGFPTKASNQAATDDQKAGIRFEAIKTISGKNDKINNSESLTLSPNGRILNWWGLVVPLDGGEPFKLADLNVAAASWSPNGKLVAFRGGDGKGLYVIPVEANTGRATGPAKELISDVLNLWPTPRLDWTPDSEKIVFKTWDSRSGHSISRAVSVRNGETTEAPDWADLGIRSPDGETIAYSPQGHGIWIRAAAGGPSRNLSGPGPYKRCEPSGWSNDGQWIIGYASQGPTGDEVRIIHFPDGKEYKIVVPDSAGRFVGKSLTGDRLFFYRTSYELAYVPKVASIYGGVPMSLPRRWLAKSVPSFTWPKDGGTLIVTVREESGFNRWLYPLTGGEPSELKIDVPGQFGFGLFSPDGSKLLLWASEAGGKPGCFIVPVSLKESRTTGSPMRLSSDSTIPGGAAWSPDGTQIALTRDHELGIVSGDGRNWRRLAKTEANQGDLAWSPDGTSLAYHFYEGAKTEIWVLRVTPTSDGVIKKILNSSTVHGFPRWSWSPDSQSLTIALEGAISQFPISNGEAREILKLKDLGYGGASWLAWSSDGRKLLFYATGSPTASNALFLWEPQNAKARKVDVNGLSAAGNWLYLSADSQQIGYSCQETTKTRPAGVLSRLDIGEVLKRIADGTMLASPLAERPASATIASPKPVPLTDSQFTDNFDSGASPSWIFTEFPNNGPPYEHSVKDGELVLENSAAFLSETPWTNYVLRARVCLKSAKPSGYGNVAFRARRTPQDSGVTDFYHFSLMCFGSRPLMFYLGEGYRDPLGRYQDDGLDHRPAAFALDKWYAIEFQVKGHHLRGYLDGQLVVEATDYRLLSGGVGISASNAQAHLDDVSVQLLP